MTHRPTHCFVAAALIAALAGCAGGTSGKRYLDANMDFGAVKTVAVVPFANLTRDNLAGDRVRDVFANGLLATGAVYVLPLGEVARAIGRVGVVNPAAPSVEEVTKLCQQLKADAVITAVVKEYGEVRSGTATANIVALNAQMQEASTGKVVWSGSTSKGGIGLGDRLIGGGGSPMNDVTEAAVNDLLNKLLR